MLRLTLPGERKPRPSGRPSYAERVSFGGVVFDLLSAEPLIPGLSATRGLSRGADARTVADVACAVHVDAGRVWPSTPPSDIRFATDAASGKTQVRAATFEVELSQLGPGRYAAAAQVAPGVDALVGLLRGVAAAIVHREGGLLVHAAGLELDGAAVLLVGPSGAGKSTALRHSSAGSCFAFDHVALVRVTGQWFAWGLPGGTAPGAHDAFDAAYPLAGVLRVRKLTTASAPRAGGLSGAQALFVLRESVECADQSAGAEDVYLHAVMELSSQVPVGAIETVLGCDNVQPIRGWLRRQRERAVT